MHLKHRVNVIGHYTPSSEAVALSVEMKKRILGDSCRTGIAKNARSMTSIFVALDLAAEINHAGVGRGRVTIDVQLELPGVHYLLRKSIRQPKRDVLNGAWIVEVWQIPS